MDCSSICGDADTEGFCCGGLFAGWLGSALERSEEELGLDPDKQQKTKQNETKTTEMLR